MDGGDINKDLCEIVKNTHLDKYVIIPSPYNPYIHNTREMILTNICQCVGPDFVDKEIVVDHMAYVYPAAPADWLEYLCYFNVWGFMVDDLLEPYPDQFSRFLNRLKYPNFKYDQGAPMGIDKLMDLTYTGSYSH